MLRRKLGHPAAETGFIVTVAKAVIGSCTERGTGRGSP
jgi:hypothetical protein